MAKRVPHDGAGSQASTARPRRTCQPANTPPRTSDAIFEFNIKEQHGNMGTRHTRAGDLSDGPRSAQGPASARRGT